MSAPLLQIEHLEVHYGDLIGVSDVSLEVPEGSVVVFAATLNSRVFYLVLGISLVSFWVSSSLAEKRGAAGPG